MNKILRYSFLMVILVALLFVLTIPITVSAANCAGAETSIIECDKEGKGAIGFVLGEIIKILSIGVGVVLIGSVVYGAILYTTGGGTPANIQKAISVWNNAVVGAIMFAFFVAIINFFIPGGVFGG